LLMVDGLIFCWFPTSTIRFSAETSTAFNCPPQLPRTPLPTLACIQEWGTASALALALFL
ncbi:hypothetical protein, partial [Paraburkholderia xenovorans]|uniref:hypothetical protein n=1 Tax=Paraburkholderia xenovorans TaxID=36873 RepID=UPI001C131081